MSSRLSVAYSLFMYCLDVHTVFDILIQSHPPDSLAPHHLLRDHPRRLFPSIEALSCVAAPGLLGNFCLS